MIIMTTNFGNIHLSLDTVNTPKTAENFLKYAKNSFYEGTIFHRVINGFMIQGGGFEANLHQKEVNGTIENEADKGKPNVRGTIAMARTSDPHSATTQFFINVSNNNFLNFTNKTPEGWGYCVFGEVTDGMDVVDQIRKIQTTTKAGYDDVPKEDVIIEKVTVVNE